MTNKEIHRICKQYGIEDYVILDDGRLDVEGSVDFYNRGLKKLPLKFRRIGGSFNCSFNHLTSLEGSPEEVGGSFLCESNQLTSLEGSPEWVGRSFYCESNQLTSLEGCPEVVGEGFYYSNNKKEFSFKDVEEAKLNSRERRLLRERIEFLGKMLDD